MLGLYFSGTGNTRYCVEQFVSAVENGAKSFSIEDSNIINELPKHDIIVFGFPIYYSNLPKIVKDFIAENANVFKGKKVFIIATKALFNAYGVGHATNLFKKYGAEYIGSLQVYMPNNIWDSPNGILFSKNYIKIYKKADEKIAKAAQKYEDNKPTKSGLNILNLVFGAVLKILPFYPKTSNYISAPKIDNEKCTGCEKCVNICPMNNIENVNDKAVSSDRCTICYRCFSYCPEQALTILGKKVYDQYVLA